MCAPMSISVLMPSRRSRIPAASGYCSDFVLHVAHVHARHAALVGKLGVARRFLRLRAPRLLLGANAAAATMDWLIASTRIFMAASPTRLTPRGGKRYFSSRELRCAKSQCGPTLARAWAWTGEERRRPGGIRPSLLFGVGGVQFGCNLPADWTRAPRWTRRAASHSNGTTEWPGRLVLRAVLVQTGKPRAHSTHRITDERDSCRKYGRHV